MEPNDTNEITAPGTDGAETPIQQANEVAAAAAAAKDIVSGAAGVVSALNVSENKLRDGRPFEVIAGNAMDAIRAQREIDGDPEMLMPCMIRNLTLVGGVKLPIDELLGLPLGDYLKIQAEFSAKNF